LSDDGWTNHKLFTTTISTTAVIQSQNILKANLRTGEEEAAFYFKVVFRDSNRGTDEDQSIW
jgi:hypothetical protein